MYKHSSTHDPKLHSRSNVDYSNFSSKSNSYPWWKPRLSKLASGKMRGQLQECIFCTAMDIKKGEHKGREE